MNVEQRNALLQALSRQIRRTEDAEAVCELTFNEGLDAVSGQRLLRNQLLDLISQAEVRGLLPPLIAVVRRYFGNPEELRAAAESLALDEGQGNLERCLFRDVPPVDAQQWRNDMLRCEWAVCRIETRSRQVLGTGVLVGPDLVATSRHVIDWFEDKRVPLSEIRARFDYKANETGTMVMDGNVYGPAAAVLVADSPKSALDYAVIRLAVDASADAMPTRSGGTRGWLSPEHHDFKSGEPLAIIQHPEGDPMKFAFGSVRSVQSTPPRIKYGVNTEKGSSGAPCFTQDWQLVALHQSGSTEHNTGVPWSDILPDLYDKGITLPRSP